jgi:hypothetical protein
VRPLRAAPTTGAGRCPAATVTAVLLCAKSFTIDGPWRTGQTGVAMASARLTRLLVDRL